MIGGTSHKKVIPKLEPSLEWSITNTGTLSKAPAATPSSLQDQTIVLGGLRRLIFFNPVCQGPNPNPMV
jgi:hypothetical protein